MPFQIIRNDITKVKADAIVNTAHPNVAIGGGVAEEFYHGFGDIDADTILRNHLSSELLIILEK